MSEKYEINGVITSVAGGWDFRTHHGIDCLVMKGSLEAVTAFGDEIALPIPSEECGKISAGSFIKISVTVETRKELNIHNPSRIAVSNL